MQDSESQWFAWYHTGSQKKKESNFIKRLGLPQLKLALVTTVYKGQAQQKTIP